MLDLHTHLCYIRSRDKASVFENIVLVSGGASWEALGSISSSQKEKKSKIGRAEERKKYERRNGETLCLRTFSSRSLHLKIALIQGRQMALELEVLRLLQRTGYQFPAAGQNCLELHFSVRHGKGI